jgi:hypothetical protein
MQNKRILLNLALFSGLPQCEQFPFIDFMKGANGPQPALEKYAHLLNANGAPTSAPSSDVGWSGLPVPSSATYAGPYVYQIPGTGAARIRMDTAGFTVSSGSQFLASSTSGQVVDIVGTNPRIEFTPNNSQGIWGLSFLAGQTYSGMGAPRLCRVADEAAMLAGKFYNPDYIDHMRAIKLGCARFMHWDNIDGYNNINSQPFTVQQLETGWGWAGLNYPPQLLSASDITSGDGGRSYVCSAAPSTPGSITDGEMIFGWATTTNLAGATLNVGGRGTKPIWDGQFSLLPVTGGEFPYAGFPIVGGGQYVFFTYDAILDAYMAIPYYMISGAPPLSVKIALCNELECDPWFCFPNLTLSSEAELFGKNVAENLDPALTAHVEYGNEPWGGTGHTAGFTTRWANKLFTGPGLGIGSTLPIKIKQIMDGVTAGWTAAGRSLATLDRTSMWTTYDGLTTFGLDGAYIPAGQGYDSYKSDPGWAYRVIESNGCAPYFQGTCVSSGDAGYIATGQEPLYTWADWYASGDPVKMDAALAAVDANLRGTDGIAGNGDPSNLAYTIGTVFAGREADAAVEDARRASLGLPPFKVCNYEGGIEIIPPSVARLNALGLNGALYGYEPSSGTMTGRIGDMYLAYLNSALFKQLVLDYLSKFYALPHSSMQAWFEGVGAGYVTSSNKWSMSPAGLYSTPFKSYDAIAQWDNAGSNPAHVSLSIVYRDQNKNPMLTKPTPDAAPTWSNTNPTVDALTPSGESCDVNRSVSGSDTVNLSVVVGGKKFAASMPITPL